MALSISTFVTKFLRELDTPTSKNIPFGRAESLELLRTISRVRLLNLFLATAFPYFFDIAKPSLKGSFSKFSGLIQRIQTQEEENVLPFEIKAHWSLPRIFQSVDCFISTPILCGQKNSYALRRFRPFSRRRLRTARPAFVAIRVVKPCLRDLLRLLGWKVRFVDIINLLCDSVLLKYQLKSNLYRVVHLSNRKGFSPIHEQCPEFEACGNRHVHTSGKLILYLSL